MIIEQLNQKFGKKDYNSNNKKGNNINSNVFSETMKSGKSYYPSRINVFERVPIIKYSSKKVLNDLKEKVEMYDDELPKIQESSKLLKKMKHSQKIEPIMKKIEKTNDYKLNPIAKKDKNEMLFNNIFVEPKEKKLKELKEKEKEFETMLYEGIGNQYDKLLEIYDSEKEKPKLEKILNANSTTALNSIETINFSGIFKTTLNNFDLKSNKEFSKNFFFDQQIQAEIKKLLPFFKFFINSGSTS